MLATPTPTKRAAGLPLAAILSFLDVRSARTMFARSITMALASGIREIGPRRSTSASNIALLAGPMAPVGGRTVASHDASPDAGRRSCRARSTASPRQNRQEHTVLANNALICAYYRLSARRWQEFNQPERNQTMTDSHDAVLPAFTEHRVQHADVVRMVLAGDWP